MMTDVLIIGGGLAGWRAAESAARAGVSVTLVASGAGNSPEIHALNCPVRQEDSVEQYMADTLSSGRGANGPELVRVMCEGAAGLKEEFAFDREADGSYKTIQPLGSTVPRCVSIGHAIGKCALAKLKRDLVGKVQVLNGRVTQLKRQGALFVAQGGNALTLEAKTVILATGGWCGKYDFSTNPPELRGDGIALAQMLGAAVRDVDETHVQYEPTVRIDGPLRGVPVITTLLFEGARLLNDAGEAFLEDPQANKDVLSRAIRAEMARTGADGVWYDLTDVPDAALRTCGMDPEERRIRVAPAPHSSLGGIAIDTACRVLDVRGAPIAGLFAAGEVTAGVHGLNRLGGNGGTSVLVFGRIAGESAAASVCALNVER